MQTATGRVVEIQAFGDGQNLARAAWIACPPALVPAPGRYVQAHAAEDPSAPLAVSLFPAQVEAQAFLAASPLPPDWEPGTRLELRGPLGRGFHLPTSARRLACIALGASAGRLLPLLRPALAQGAAVAFFSDAPLPALPSEIEIHRLSAAEEGIRWADFLALDLEIERLERLPQILPWLACPGEVLVVTPMPCTGIAACGACAVPVARRGWKLACLDGPVFRLDELLER